jgi:Fe-S cluster assembly iron-binding protein IscA
MSSVKLTPDTSRKIREFVKSTEWRGETGLRIGIERLVCEAIEEDRNMRGHDAEYMRNFEKHLRRE